MTTSKRASDFVVGITVMTVTAAIIAGTLWLNRADLSGSTRHLTARTRDVGGVSLGNPVVIRGVRAGRVEGITLGDDNWVVLKLGLDMAQFGVLLFEIGLRLIDIAHKLLLLSLRFVLAQQPEQFLFFFLIGLQRMESFGDFGLCLELLEICIELAQNIFDPQQIFTRVI